MPVSKSIRSLGWVALVAFLAIARTALAHPKPVPKAEAPGRDKLASAVPSSTSSAHRVGQDLFEVSAGVEGGMRHFTYTDGR